MLGKLREGPGTCVRLWFCRQLIFLMFLSFKLLGVWRMDWKKRRHQRKCKLIYFASNTRFIIFLSWFCPCHITDCQLLNLAAILYPSLPILLLSTLCSGLQNSRFLICSPHPHPAPSSFDFAFFTDVFAYSQLFLQTTFDCVTKMIFLKQIRSCHFSAWKYSVIWTIKFTRKAMTNQ